MMWNFSCNFIVLLVFCVGETVVASGFLTDCYVVGASYEYAGTTNTTASGLTCQRWDSQSPHQHSQELGIFPEVSLCKAKNYCRDPDTTGYPWCYTTDNYTRWEACAVPECDPPITNTSSPSDCYNDEPRGYSGSVNTTVSGLTCQDWDSQSPHKHSQSSNSQNFPERSLCKARNYCRDPDNTGYPWCYTTDNDTRWQACPVPECDQPITNTSTPSDCYNDEPRGYSGSVNTTVSGLTCQDWDSQSPHKHSQTSENLPEQSLFKARNYCRDPDNTGYLWCYTTDEYTRYEECNIPQCYQSTTHSSNTSGSSNCYSGNSTDYSGYVNTTISGLTCQRWDSQSPHKHYKSREKFPERSPCKARNYCRDPENNGYLWCYTTDETTIWEKCDVCHEGVTLIPRYTTTGIPGYTSTDTPGNTSTDTLGYTSTDIPGSTSIDTRDYTSTGFPDYTKTGFPGDTTGFAGYTSTGTTGYTSTNTPGNTSTGTPGYTGTGTPGYTSTGTPGYTSTGTPGYTSTGTPGYTSNGTPGYTSTGTPSYTNTDCYEGDHRAYNGTWHRTQTGRECQRWDVQSPHSHSNTESYRFPDVRVSDAHNYCRDPDNDGMLWCYTTDPETRWEYCDIQECNGNA